MEYYKFNVTWYEMILYRYYLFIYSLKIVVNNNSAILCIVASKVATIRFRAILTSPAKCR